MSRRRERHTVSRGVGIAAAAAALAVLTACTTEPGEPSDPAVPGAAPAVAGETGGNPYVQDLWIYERLRTLDGSGRIVDHTDRIIDHMEDRGSSSPPPPVELIPGMDFQPVPDVAAHVQDADGERRPDVEAVAGLVTNEIGTAFAVLATVDADGEDQIRPDDRVFLDTTFLADAIEIGDLMAADFSLVQLGPTGDPAEADLSALDLASHRATREELFYSADEDGDPVVFTDELGRIVEGSEGPLIPTKAQPMLSGFGKGIKKCFTSPGVKCISGYFKEFGKGSTDSLNQIDKQLPIPPPSDRPPGRQAGPSVRDPLPCQQHCGKSTGDPHLTTYDGLRYGMQGVGEFVLTRHTQEDLEVQVRTAPVGSSTRLSVVTVVAVKLGASRVVIDADGVSVDGRDLAVTTAAETTDGEGFSVTTRGRTVAVQTAAGHLVTVERRAASLDLVISPGDDVDSWVGLLGDLDGDTTDDLAARDGTVVSPEAGLAVLYRDFVDGWRVTPAESVLPYAAGEDTSDFTDRDFPSGPATSEDLSATDRERARAACELAGVESPEAMAECIVDFAATQDVEFLLSARVSDAVVGILSGRLASDGSAATSATDGTDDGTDDRAGLDIWYATGLGALGDRESGVFTCAPTDRGYLSSLYGDGAYGAGTGLCLAAVHAGVITFAEGGDVRVTREGVREGIPGMTRNGVTSRPWSPRTETFSVARP